MNKLPWSDYLLTGNEVIDFQHKKLFNLLNILLIEAKRDITNQLVLDRALNNFLEYAILHFEDEEVIHESHEYPNLMTHQKIHQDFISQFSYLKKQIELGEHAVFEIITYINSWLIAHIRSEDMQAVQFAMAPKI